MEGSKKPFTIKDSKCDMYKIDLENLEKQLLSSDEYDSEYETDSSDNYESEAESQLNSQPSSGPSESSEDDMVFEHTLKHHTFFATVRKRRRRHTINRLKGVVPPLHFTGTYKTHFWNRYGVEPSDQLPSGSIQGVDTMFPEDEFKKLGPSERRLHVNGQIFKIIHNPAPTKTLYRAIANAIGMYGDDDPKVVRESILNEMLENWPTYSQEVSQFCAIGGGKEGVLDVQRSDPRLILETYKKLTNKQSEPPIEMELNAAAMHFGFNYSVIELNNLETPIKVRNCTDEAVVQNGSVKYHFLRCLFGGYLLSYEFLLPIGPLKRIQDGEYPTVLRDVILVERSMHRESLTELGNDINRPVLGPVPVGFGLDHRTFFHRSTISHDLWSLLAELLYGRLVHAPHIKRKIVSSKHNFMLYYLACKAKKRYQVNGNSEIQKLVDEFNERFCREQPRGNAEDLAQAASYYNFSYTLIGMDSKGNFYWTDRIPNRDDEDDEDDNPYFAFFVKTTPDRSMHWYALEDIGKYSPKEQRLYRDVQSGDLRQWGGKFYFHYLSKKMKNTGIDTGTFSSKKLLNTRTYTLIQASQWALSSIGKLRSPITDLYRSSSQVAKNIFRSVNDFMRWLLNRRRVKPDKNVQALFVRERP